MSKVGVNWHTKPKIIYSKSVVLDRYKRYLKGLGLRDETVKLYVGLVGGFLDYAEADEPSTEIANAFKDYLIEKRLSRGHINNTCFAVKRRQRTHAASGGASEALPHEVGARPSRSEPKLNTHALYPSRSELRGITFKNEKEIIRDVAKNNHMSMSDVIRILISNNIKNIQKGSTLQLV